mmetsp:Transcript_12229/g.22927  ORF Transcript_12229/g.22927 Transcript_12229/m.22927 type:complete len:337 (-) Transcript_12229:230-1240(-)
MSYYEEDESSLFKSSRSGKAFGLVIAAAASTAIGASAVFFPYLAKFATPPILAASLGFAAGVMLYVSLVDIYGKAQDGFIESGHSEEAAFIYGTLSFFAGILLMKILNIFIHAILRSTGEEEDILEKGMDEMVARNLENLQGNEIFSENTLDDNLESGKRIEDSSNKTERLSDDEDLLSEEDKPILYKTGVATAFAIALHNFPEGLVTFVSYVSEPAVGVALAVGISIHNIPEGLCVAMPIYYATGNRWKGFFWGTLSGFSEPLGALVGWLIVGRSFSGNAYGIMFGAVAGIMVYICLDELLPTAYKYNRKGSIVNWSSIFGMFLIALSLVLFSLS